MDDRDHHADLVQDHVDYVDRARRESLSSWMAVAAFNVAFVAALFLAAWLFQR